MLLVSDVTIPVIWHPELVTGDSELEFEITSEGPSSRERFPRLHDFGESCCGLDECMNVVGHDAPSGDSVSFPIKSEESVLHDLCDLRMSERATTGAVVSPLFETPYACLVAQ